MNTARRLIGSFKNIFARVRRRFGRYASPVNYPLSVFREELIYNINLAPYLDTYKKQSVENVRDHSYELRLTYGAYWYRGCTDTKIWRDAPYTLILFRRGRLWQHALPLACIGFDIREHGTHEQRKEIFVRQIQATSGRENHFECLRWEKMLLAILIDWARTQHIATIRVQSAENNEWKHRVIMERLRLRYDVTAKRMGFTRDEEYGNYVLAL